MDSPKRGDRFEHGGKVYVITGINKVNSKTPDEPGFLDIRAISVDEARRRRDSLTDLLNDDGSLPR